MNIKVAAFTVSEKSINIFDEKIVNKCFFSIDLYLVGKRWVMQSTEYYQEIKRILCENDQRW